MPSWQMVSCGRCRRCLVSPAHGPYLFFHKSGGKRIHRYGGKSAVPGEQAPVSLRNLGGPDGYAGARLDRAREEERERVRAKADAEYERRKACLTPAQTGKIDAVMALLARLKLVQRRQRDETDRRVREAEREHSSPRGGGSAARPGLIARAAAQIRAEVAEQFALEIKTIRKDIAHQKAELRKMLKAS